MKVKNIVFGFAFCLICLTPTLSHASVLWSNGDYEGTEMWAANYFSSATNYEFIYDDFNVPTGGWTINNVWSNNIMNSGDEQYTSTQAKWEIRSGVSAGNPGTVESSGTSSVSQTFVQRFDYGGYYEDLYKLQVDNLNIVLPEGKYWLTVAPIVELPANVFGGPSIGNTSKTNAVGEPSAINGNNYFYRYQYDATIPGYTDHFGAYSELYSFGPVDFSMGVGNDATPTNNAVPEPATMLMFGTGMLGAFFRRKSA